MRFLEDPSQLYHIDSPSSHQLTKLLYHQRMTQYVLGNLCELKLITLYKYSNINAIRDMMEESHKLIITENSEYGSHQLCRGIFKISFP